MVLRFIDLFLQNLEGLHTYLGARDEKKKDSGECIIILFLAECTDCPGDQANHIRKWVFFFTYLVNTQGISKGKVFSDLIAKTKKYSQKKICPNFWAGL